MEKILVELVRFVFNSPSVKWTIQGFGMARCYLGDDAVRLNIWHREFQVPNVSIMHNHPWDLYSYVVAGRIHNTRYVRDDALGVKYQHVLIHPGMGHSKAIVQSHVDTVRLTVYPVETYEAGQSYSQSADEVHKTSYVDGTVTINHRTNRGEDKADVYWLNGDWVSAEPREATPEEVAFIIAKARWVMSVDEASRKK